MIIYRYMDMYSCILKSENISVVPVTAISPIRSRYTNMRFSPCAVYPCGWCFVQNQFGINNICSHIRPIYENPHVPIAFLIHLFPVLLLTFIQMYYSGFLYVFQPGISSLLLKIIKKLYFCCKMLNFALFCAIIKRLKFYTLYVLFFLLYPKKFVF